MEISSDLPAARPSSGIEPNFVDPPAQAHSIIVLEAMFLPSMLLAVLMRIFVRARITRVWGWDDYACFVPACGSIAHVICYTQNVINIGYGRHLWDIRAVVLLNDRNGRTLSATSIAYPFTIFFAKVFILLLYLRVFDVDYTIRRGVWGGIIFQALFYLGTIGLGIGAIVQCYGISQISNQFCIHFASEVVIAISAVNFVTDIFVLILPIHRVLKLQLNFKRKLSLLMVFAGGLLTCAASLARLINFAGKYDSSDILWVQATNAQFTIVEINIISCVSTFPAFFSKTKSVGAGLYSTVRLHLTSLRSTSSSLPTPSALQSSAVKNTADSWNWDERTHLNDVNGQGNHELVNRDRGQQKCVKTVIYDSDEGNW